LRDKDYVYTNKEVLWYFDFAFQVEADYFSMPTDHPVRMGWWDIKSVLETFDKRSQNLFRLFYEGFTPEEISVELQQDITKVYQLKYKLVNRIVRTLNKPNRKPIS